MALFPFRNPVSESDSQDEWVPVGPKGSESNPIDLGTMSSKPSKDDEWTPVSEPTIKQDISKPTTEIPKVEPEKSLLEKGWEVINKPLTTIPSDIGKSVSKFIDPNQGTSGLRAVGSAFAESLGNVGSSLTSPLNAATALATGGESLAGKMGFPAVARMMNIFGKSAGVPTAVHGASNVLSPDSSMADRAIGLGEMGLGALPFAHSTIKPTEEIPKSEPEINVKTEVPQLSPQVNDKIVAVDENAAQNKIRARITAIQRNIDKSGQPMPDNVRVLLNDLKSQITKTGPDAVYIKKPDPAIIKEVMQKGYKFDSLRDDGAYKMVRSYEPINTPSGPPNKPPISTPIDAVPNQPPNNKSNILTEAFNFPRAVMASMNFHAPLRQGLPLIHKKEFWTSLDDMFRAWGSEEAYNTIQSDIASRPGANFAQQSGLKLTNLDTLSTREENIMDTWAERVPGVRRSNRAYTVFLNKLRSDTFDSLIRDNPEAKSNMPLSNALADFVNTASGRGSLGSLEKSATLLNTFLFSPRLIASRLKLLNPVYYVTAPPQVRKEAIKSLLSVAGTGTIVSQLGKLAGGEVTTDPTSTDFGKMKIGNVRVDPYGGFQQYVVAANRLIQGKSTSITGKEHNLDSGQYGGQTRMDVVKNLLVSKANPPLAFAYDLLNGAKDATGKLMDFTTTNPINNAVAKQFIPIVLQDIAQVAKENPDLLPITVPLNMFGMGSNVYGGR